MSNSTSLTSLQGPGKYQSTMDAVTGSGKLGQLHQSFDNSAEELLMHRDNLELTGEGYETRGRKFTKTVKTFFKAGGDVGALVGTVTMLPSDLLVGRGNKSSGRPSLTDEGILGNGANFVGSCVSGSVEFVGKGVGGAAAVVAMPAKDVEKDTKEWLRNSYRRLCCWNRNRTSFGYCHRHYA